MIHVSKNKNLFLLIIFLFSSACLRPQAKICIKDSEQYCITSDRIYVVNWDTCYRRGVSCMEGRCWEYAVEEFERAINARYQDQRDVRAYGMHFRKEYFPHRELGICYFHLGMIGQALDELELSMEQTPSARAKYYLNHTRRSYLLSTGQDIQPPTIYLELSENKNLTNKTPFQIKGIVKDDHYVASLYLNQMPVFIELAQPSMPFSHPVNLKEGWNTVSVIAKDLVDKQIEKSISIFLDQRGPLVIVKKVQSEKTEGSEHMLLTLFAYDESGIVSFKLNQEEIPKLQLDTICLIQQTVSSINIKKSIPFCTQDGAGNSTHGKIYLTPDPKRGTKASIRIACNGPGLRLIAANAREDAISLDITHPPKDDFITYYDETFLEGRIEALDGIERIALNGRQLFSSAIIQNVVEDNMQNLVQMLIKQNKDPQKYIQLLKEVIQSCTIYHINQKIPLIKENTLLNLTVEDTLGKKGTKHYRIRKIPIGDVLKSEQRMIMSLLPFDSTAKDEFDLTDYIYNKLIESFSSQGRFNLVEREKLPWVFIEKTIQSSGRIYEKNVAQQIGQIASSEGVVCGYIQKREDGVEIVARFVEVDTGLIRLVHDVFTPSEDIDDIQIITSGLAMKFRDSFPFCTGTITAKKGKTIEVDIGSDEGIFPGMGFNIFKDEYELLSKAYIREVAQKFSEAEIPKGEKRSGIKAGWKIRTR